MADSSSDDNKKLNKNIIASVSNLTIQYLDHYSREMVSHHKFADAVNYAESKYCVFCADDDFITPNGIKQSVDFLEKNPDYVIAQGRFIGFRLENHRGNKRRFRWKFADPPISIEFPKPESRFEYHMSLYTTSTIYGVHRTEALQRVYKELLKSKVDPLFFGELLPSMLTLIYGKMKCLNVLYGARNEHTIGVGWPTLGDAIESGTFDEKYARFRECLVTNLSKVSRLSTEDSGKLVDRAFSVYLHGRSLMPVVSIPKSKKRTALEYLHLPHWMQNGIIASYALSNKVATVKTKSLYNKLLGKPLFSLMNHGDFTRVRFHALSESETRRDKWTESGANS